MWRNRMDEDVRYVGMLCVDVFCGTLHLLAAAGLAMAVVSLALYIPPPVLCCDLHRHVLQQDFKKGFFRCGRK